MKIIKKFIIPIIVVIIFAVIYFLIYPKFINNKTTKGTLFNDFEKGLNDLKVEYKKEKVDASEFGAKESYSYLANNSKLIIYVFDKNSEKYTKGQTEGFIQSETYEESKLYGIFTNNCVLYMESDFPKDAEILNMFITLSEKYNSDK